MSDPLDFGADRVCRLFDNYATPLTTIASSPVSVPAGAAGARPVRITTRWGTTPTVLSLAVQRSVDNVTWATLYTFTKLLERDGVDLVTEGYIRVYVTTNTGGANLTVELEYGSDPKVRLNPTPTNEADHDFLPLSFKSNATGDGSVNGLLVELESTGALHYYDTAIYGIMHCNVSAGNLRNPSALQGDLTFESGCWVQGLGYGIGTYITFPPSSCQTGTFTGINIEFSVPTGWSGHLNNVTHSIFRFALSGDGASGFDTSGYFLHVTGLTEGAGKVLRVAAPTTAAASLRCKIGTTTYYLPLFSTQN